MEVRYDLTGAVALVTGGASGIGRAMAELLGASKATVVVADRNAEQGAAVVQGLRAAGGTAIFRQVDVTDESAVLELIHAIERDEGRLDIAMNNAGIESEIVPVGDLDPSSWRRVIEVNLTATYYCMRAELSLMRKQGCGAIVNTSSVLGLMGSYSHADYTASKHGVVGLTKAAALDHARDGIRINAVCPGLVDTPFSGEMPTRIRDRLIFSIPVGRMAAPEEIARAAVWLCSPGASYVTGVALPVDGGVVVGGTGTRFDDLM